MDNGEPAFTHVNDQVTGLTIAQIFTPLQSDVSSLSQYRTKLLQQIEATPTQTNNINNLFSSYGY